MAKSETLRLLRLQLGDTLYSEKETWPAPLLPGGVAKGIVAELVGNGRTEWLLQFFQSHPQNLIFWCEREPAVSPTALHQRGIDLRRVLFVQAPHDLQKVLHRALESGHYPFIVAPNRVPDVRALQRLHLLAGRSSSTVFLLAEESLSQAWPISLQMEIQFDGTGLQLQVARQKHGGYH